MQDNDKKWTKHSQNWNRLGPPLRPTQGVIAEMVRVATPGRTLMLGVTPEIHAAFDSIIAVDLDHDMIRNVWPGDTDTKTAIQGEWTSMRWPDSSFDNIVCDGGLSMLENLDNMRYFQALCMRWLRSGGSVVHRVFERPSGDQTITAERLRREMQGFTTVNWHAFKWLLAFYVAESQDDSSIRLIDIMHLFNELCDDRAALAERTGWSMDSINTIDLYQGSSKVTCFGTRAEHLATIPSAAIGTEMWTVPGYDLHEHCPMMVWRKP